MLKERLRERGVSDSVLEIVDELQFESRIAPSVRKLQKEVYAGNITKPELMQLLTAQLRSTRPPPRTEDGD